MSWAALVILLLIVGAALLAIEILVIPGFGVTGVLGIGSVIGAGVVAWTQLGSTYGVLAFGAGIAASVVMFWLFPRTGVGKAMVLNEAQRGTRAPDPALAALVGRAGRALTPLKPSGAAEIDDRTVDVVTDGIWVEADAAVKVVRVEGVRVVVEPVDAPAEESSREEGSR